MTLWKGVQQLESCGMKVTIPTAIIRLLLWKYDHHSQTDSPRWGATTDFVKVQNTHSILCNFIIEKWIVLQAPAQAGAMNSNFQPKHLCWAPSTAVLFEIIQSN